NNYWVMPFTILLTGFGPFPGAPFNPTDALVRALAHVRHPRLAGTRRIAHVFATRYDTVDRELPALIARERPAAVLMFGLAARTVGELVAAGEAILLAAVAAARGHH